MNSLFEDEIRGHHRMRDHLLTVVSDADLDDKLPGQNPTLGELLVELGEIEGIYTHSFESFTFDSVAPPDFRHRRRSPSPACKPGSKRRTLRWNAR